MLTAPRTQSPPGWGGADGSAGALAGTPGRSERVTRPVSLSRPAATLALAVLTCASAAGLLRVFAGRHWIGPVLGTIVVVHFVCWALRARRVRSVPAAVVVTATILLMLCWTVLGRYTSHGIPTGSTWHHAVSALRDLGNEIATMTAPVQSTTAFLLVAVGGAAVAAGVADWAAFRWRLPMLALVPGLAAFIFCATSGGGRGRGTTVGLEVAAAGLFLLVERASGGDGLVWFAGVRTGVGQWALAAGGVIMAASVVTAVSVSPALARRDGTGVMGWHSDLGPNGGERVVPNPLVDLRTRLTQLSQRPVFVVDSTVPSYWRLTSLDTFDGTTWTSTGSYAGFGSKLPGVPPEGASVRTVRATFQIQDLDSVWLPAQFDPIAVQGASHVTYDPQSNSLLTKKTTRSGLEYSVTSYQYLDTLQASALDTAPPLPTSSVVAHDLQLPASLPTRVIDLAQAITANSATEYDKAIAIQAFLRQSGRFTYSLNPPSDGTGTDALYTFLFQTKEGYCQQFAGAYAVLARAAGLPTRLAVGFAQGDPSGSGYQVRDSDYHTWPEVYFGPKFGWVPFEPTPGFTLPGSSGYSGTSSGSTGPTAPPTTAPPTTVPGGNGTSPTTIVKPKPTPATTVPVTSAAHPTGGVSPWWLVIPAVALAWIGLTAGVPLLLRRGRHRRAARAGTEAVVLNEWNRLASQLEWHGIERRPDETDDEFARRAALALRRLGIDGRWTYGGVEALAGMARQAAFAPSVPEGLGEQAAVAAREIHDRLASVTARSRRIARLWLPPPGTWRRLGGFVRSPTRRQRAEPGASSAPVA